MKEKALLIIDVQNDFVTGSLGSEYAKTTVVPNIVELAKQFDLCDIYATLDTHFNTLYLSSPEGKKLPIKHCIKGTEGHKLVNEIDEIVPMNHRFSKLTFGMNPDVLFKTFFEYKEVHICGLVTDICVITNALAFKSKVQLDHTNVVVHENCCGGTSKENHDAAIKVMRSCQIDIV